MTKEQDVIKKGTHFHYTRGSYSDTCYYVCIALRDITHSYASELHASCMKRYEEVDEASDNFATTGYIQRELLPLALLIKRGDVQYIPTYMRLDAGYGDELEVYDSSYDMQDDIYGAKDFVNKYFSGE